jgi:hypothetical protein
MQVRKHVAIQRGVGFAAPFRSTAGFVATSLSYNTTVSAGAEGFLDVAILQGYSFYFTYHWPTTDTPKRSGSNPGNGVENRR